MMHSLRSRLIIGMFCGMAVLLAVAGSIVYTVQRHQLYQAFDDTLVSSANSFALLFHPGPGGIEFDASRAASLPAGQVRQGALFQFWSRWPVRVAPSQQSPRAEDGPVFPSGPPPHHPPPPGPSGPGWDELGPPPRPEPYESRAPGEVARVIRSPLLAGADLPRLEPAPGELRFETITLPNGTIGRAVGLRFHAPLSMGPNPGRGASAEVTAVVAADITEIEKQLRFLTILLAATALGTMAISGGMAWLVVSRGLRPLARVARKIGTLDETGLKQRIAGYDVPREIEPVVGQLNGLLKRLDAAFDRERSLTADVAHELRTPVAEICTIAEISLSRQRDTDEYRQALGDTLEAARGLQGLIEKLLVLARLEAGQMRPELDMIAIKPVLERLYGHLRRTAEERGLTFEENCPPDAMVTADPKLLDVILSNGLSNAVAYTPPGGRITVEAEVAGNTCTITVVNTGCELSRHEVSNVFDRFWRGDAARSGRTGLNCGLGLTLVRRAMELIGGKADASVSEDRSFILTLTFRAVEDDA